MSLVKIGEISTINKEETMETLKMRGHKLLLTKKFLLL